MSGAGRAFLKMHGLRNHFVIVDGRAEAYRPGRQEIVAICDPQAGVGADQLVVIEHPLAPSRRSGAAAFLRFYNVDGSEAEACGNATRCVAWLLLEEQGVRGDKTSVTERLREELVSAACDRAFFVDEGPVRDRKTFEARVVKAKTRLAEVANELCRLTAEILAGYQVLRSRLNESRYAAWPRAIADVRGQLKALLAEGFIVSVPFEHLKHYPRYLEAIGVRLDKLTI